MAININGINIVGDAVVEPVSLTDAKNWMRIDYSDDDTLIRNLLQSSRVHIEKLCGLSLVNKQIVANIELTGTHPGVWMVDLPYGPLVCINSIKWKTGMNTWDTLTKNEDYEIIGGKLWLYYGGFYEIDYDCGFSNLPSDLAADILTLTTWQYENRGKKFQGDARAGMVVQYPNWDGLNYHNYKKIMI